MASSASDSISVARTPSASRRTRFAGFRRERHRRGERAGVAAVVDAGQARHRGRGALDEAVGRPGHHRLYVRFRAAPSLVEAAHARVEERLGLLAADARGFARLGAHRDPRGLVVVERALHGREREARRGALGARERGAQVAFPARVERVAPLARGGAAHGRRRLAERERTRRDRERERDAERELRSPERSRREIVEHRPHARVAFVRVRAEAA